ncbi:DUF2793 domain-containing protein [Sphingobium bisphenolivorans]|uniref:DUF2793 domain-containing protein n=1 Tax=Sphingobium bisphenolivorans TaxID=1335760 RepID=UPI0003B41E5B|nr:DUF2793 domain-containing protein [Sphingobium bisphenolivorans]
MSVDMTARWGLPFLFAGQAQKELYHNEALALIDMLLHGWAESADQAIPPSAPVVGTCWIVAEDAGDAWEGQEGAVACWTDGGWRFVTPRSGLSLWVSDRGHALHYDGTDWQDSSLRQDGLYIAGQRVVGERADAIAYPSGGGSVDAEGRAAIARIIDVLRAHGLVEP